MKRLSMNHPQHRSAREVLEDHLRESTADSIESDLARNYSPDLVVLSGRGVYHGHDGLRQLAELMRHELPESSFEYRTILLEGEMGFLEWTGRSSTAYVDDGVDTYLIQHGQIVAQTTHYTVKPLSKRQQ